MKKSIVLVVALLCAFMLVSCDFGSGTKNNSSGSETKEEQTVKTDEYKNHKKMLSLVEKYEVAGTNGYDYAVEQKYNGSVTNAHTVSIRLIGNNGSRVEYTKNLNEDISKGLYTEKQATSYFKEGKIATFDGNDWIWEVSKFDDFASVEFASFSFDVSSLKNLELTTVENNAVLTFSVEDDKAGTFLGSQKSVQNLKFEIKTSADYSSLVSLTMTYTQDKTATAFSFVPYTKTVTEIDFPQ